MPPLAGPVTDAVIGAVLSSVKLTALPVNVLPTLSVAVARTVYTPSLSDAHVGSVALPVHAAAVLLVVALWVVARFETDACQAVSAPWRSSDLRCKLKVVLLAFRPTPPLLSAVLPVKPAGTVTARNAL